MRTQHVAFVSLFSLFLAGCSSVDQGWVKSSLQDSFKNCGGEVVDLTLVREGIFSNKYDGFATVKIRGGEYSPDVTVYADGNSTFYRNQDACALHEAENSGREIQQSLSNLMN